MLKKDSNLIMNRQLYHKCHIVKINTLNGTKQLLDSKGPKAVADWVREQNDVLVTDTTFRDAHQSLLATRVRTKDMMNIASKTAEVFKDSFS